MEVITKLVNETKRLAMEEEEVKQELTQLRHELMLQEQNYNANVKDYEMLCNQTTNLQQQLDANQRQIDLVKLMRSPIRVSVMLHSFLKTFIDKTNPTREQQMERLAKIQENYTKMLQKYEDTPSYHAILREEANEKELMNLIEDMRNKLSKLETERQF